MKISLMKLKKVQSNIWIAKRPTAINIHLTKFTIRTTKLVINEITVNNQSRQDESLEIVSNTSQVINVI